MSTINEIYQYTAESMRILSPLRVHCLEGENGHDVAVVYDFQYLSVMYIYFVYQYEKNCFLSPDVSINHINKRNWYYSGDITADLEDLSVSEIMERIEISLSFSDSEIYNEYSKKVFDFMSREDFGIQFHDRVSKAEPISTELNFQIFLDNANVYIQENGCGL